MLGHDNFATMMKSIFEQEVGEDSTADGEQLDHAEETKLNKLAGAHQKKNDHELKCYHNS